MAHEFTVDQVDAAIEVVIEAAMDRGQTKRYTSVFDAAGLPRPQELHQGAESHLVTEFMKSFHDRCIELGLPPLDSLVVHVAGARRGMPGAGYFKVNGLQDPLSDRVSVEDQMTATSFWQKQKHQCERWGTERRKSGR